jgi:hypothetical protein
MFKTVNSLFTKQYLADKGNSKSQNFQDISWGEGLI